MTDTQTMAPADELAAAQQHYQDLGVRIAGGDTDVTADQIAEALKQVEFLKAKVTFAAEAEAKARAERDQAAADDARKRLSRISTTKVEKAQAAAEKALSDYANAVHEYHTAFNEVSTSTYGLTQHFKREFGVLIDLADGTRYVGDLNPRDAIERMVNAAWSKSGNPGRGPFSR